MRIVNILFNQKNSAVQKIAGVEQSFIDYATIFSQNNNQVLSIIKTNSPYKSELLKAKSKICEVRLLANIDIFSILKVIFSIAIFKADVIICHSGRAFVVARIAKFFLRKPIIAINHGSNINKFLKADYVFNVNSFINSELIRIGKNPNTCFVVPNMLRIPDNLNVEESRFRQPLRIGSLGRLSGEKLYHVVIRALKILQESGIKVDFYLGGSGDQENRLRNLAKEQGVESQVKFLGWVGDKESFFDKIDIFILPSKFETFGIVLLEAMLYKTPIIASDSWGPKDIIENEIDGLLFSREDESKMPQLIANVVKKLNNDPSFANKIAQNAYKKLHKKYSMKVVSLQINKLVENIIKNTLSEFSTDQKDSNIIDSIKNVIEEINHKTNE
jgi:glycosyltransferase involved in cell wall biosynthesis